MRGVEIRAPLLVGAGALAILMFGSSAASAEDVATPRQASLTAASTDDYYTRRAKNIIEAERARTPKPHPLSARYPGMDIVVCEAGCRDESRAHVVFMRRHAVPTAPVTETTESMMVPTSADAGPTFAAPYRPGGVSCVAGCYGAAAMEPLPHPAPVIRRPIHVEKMPVAPRDKLSPVR